MTLKHNNKEICLCVKFSVDDPCLCPNECDSFSYATSLSSSQISAPEVGSILWDVDEISVSYIRSREISNRVNALEMAATLTDIQSVITHHSDLQHLMRMRVYNPATSIPAQIKKELKMILLLMQSDLNSSRRFVEKLKNCYDLNVSHVIQILSGHIHSSSLGLLQIQVKGGRKITSDELNSLEYMVGNTSGLLKAAGDNLNDTEKYDFCPANCLANICLRDKDLLMQMIKRKRQAILDAVAASKSMTSGGATATTTTLARMSDSFDNESSPTDPSVSISTAGTGTSQQSTVTASSPGYVQSSTESTRSSAPVTDAGSDSVRRTYYFGAGVMNFADIQSLATRLVNCIGGYDEFLKSLQSFLESIDLTLDAIDASVVQSETSTLIEDTVWMQSLLTAYRDNRIGKHELADEMLRTSSKRLLLKVENSVTSIENSVIASLGEVIGATETRIEAFYTKTISFLNQLERFLPKGSTTAGDHLRTFKLWRKPVPMLLDRTVNFY